MAMANSPLKSRQAHDSLGVTSQMTDKEINPNCEKPPQARLLDIHYSLSVPMVTRVCITPPPLQRLLFTS